MLDEKDKFKSSRQSSRSRRRLMGSESSSKLMGSTKGGQLVVEGDGGALLNMRAEIVFFSFFKFVFFCRSFAFAWQLNFLFV